MRININGRTKTIAALLAVMAVITGIAAATSHASATTRKPEFPTVALPIASVIGLLFFFHYRIQKEE